MTAASLKSVLGNDNKIAILCGGENLVVGGWENFWLHHPPTKENSVKRSDSAWTACICLQFR